MPFRRVRSVKCESCSAFSFARIYRRIVVTERITILFGVSESVSSGNCRTPGQVRLDPGKNPPGFFRAFHAPQNPSLPRISASRWCLSAVCCLRTCAVAEVFPLSPRHSVSTDCTSAHGTLAVAGRSVSLAPPIHGRCRVRTAFIHPHCSLMAFAIPGKVLLFVNESRNVMPLFSRGEPSRFLLPPLTQEQTGSFTSVGMRGLSPFNHK